MDTVFEDNTFYIWEIPDSRTVLVTDRPSFPQGGIAHETMDDWGKAVDYGKRIANEKRYELELDNWVGRWFVEEQKYD